MSVETTSKLTVRRICIAFIPLVALIGMIVVGVTVFGRDVGDGPSQISLVFATALAAVLAMAAGRVPWSVLEQGMTSSISKAGVSIMILFLIGMLSGAWMIGGVVPTLICYGVKIMNPHLFLACACIICAIVSLMTGTSWTTVATIGVALLGIGTALGVPVPWSAGAIISGAYFGDKLSPLSDTTILASSSTGTDLFVHIKYMLFTTIPSMTLTLIIFLVAGFFLVDASAVNVQTFSEGLSRTFHVSPWTLLVPVATGALIALRLPSLAVLFISALLGGASAVLLQGDVLLSVVGEKLPSAVGYYKALMTTFFASTHIATGSAEMNSTASDGRRKAMSAPVATGTSSVHGDTWKACESPSENVCTSTAEASTRKKPETRKMISVSVIEGIVVKSMYLMWTNRSVPVEELARIVVSLKGESLSPKYAPEMIAPALHGAGTPSAVPIPKSATPIVATVVHDVPVSRDTMAQMMQAHTRKRCGFMIFTP